jgi:hypothetical protein
MTPLSPQAVITAAALACACHNIHALLRPSDPDMRELRDRCRKGIVLAIAVYLAAALLLPPLVIAAAFTLGPPG